MQGGIADHIVYLADHLAPLDVNASILISRRWQEAKQSTAPTDQSSPPQSPNYQSPSDRSLPIGNRKSEIGNQVVYPIISNWGWRCWPAITKFLTTHQPDILHIQYQAAAFDLGGWVNWLPWYLKKRRTKTRLVTTFHDLRMPYIFPKAGPFRWKSILALARHSDAVICTDHENTHILQNQLPKYASAPPLLTHIPLGNNVEPQPPPNFNRTAWRAKYKARENTLLLAYFGFLNQSKGGEELIEALVLLRRQRIDARLLFIGGEVGHADPTNAAYAHRVQALVDQHGLTNFVQRTGYLELPEVSANLLAADAVVMPYRDGVSFRRTTLIAALRHGCPIISTTPANPSLIPEIKPGENMLLAPPKDAVALAQAIAPLAGDDAMRQRLSRGAISLGKLFDWDKIAANTDGLYQALLP
jgi:glycosyltransferase involved in cell wall biosynthesis